MDDSILDMSDDEIIVKDTQDSFSPKTFSKNIVNRLGIKSHNRGTETVDSITLTQPDAIDEAGPSTSGVVSSLSLATKAIDQHLTGPLRKVLKDKHRTSAKCDFLRSCLARNVYPKGVTPQVPLKILDAPTDLQSSWNSILQECSKKLTQQLVQHHQSKIVQQEQQAELIITDASQIIIPEYIVNIPDIAAKIEAAIEGLLCEVSLMNRTPRKGSNNNNKDLPHPKHLKKIPSPHPPLKLLPLHQKTPIHHQKTIQFQKTKKQQRKKGNKSTHGDHSN